MTHAATGAGDPMFDVSGRTVVMTGGSGVLGRVIARGMAARGANLVLVGRDLARTQGVVRELPRPGTGADMRHLALQGDVLDRQALERAAEVVLETYGRIDALVNGAGGNAPTATTSAERPFFDLPSKAIEEILALNFVGTVLPSQVFWRVMATQGEGAIVNVSSASATRPLTRVVAYSAAKAAVTNFTQWLAVHLAEEHSPALRVNAIVPGFFLTEQNRFLLTDRETGELTDRGRKIVTHTPMRRLGDPDDLVSAVIWLLSPGARFVTGAVIPIDGGFSAFSGV
jgi:NAD(P)-dependent dehydrogenase (short-subunit alcohol dehydrogenase family)